MQQSKKMDLNANLQNNIVLTQMSNNLFNQNPSHSHSHSHIHPVINRPNTAQDNTLNMPNRGYVHIGRE